MTANQRRPGFRLPWASEIDASAEGEPATADATAASAEAEAANATEAPDKSAAEEGAAATAAQAEPAAEMEAPAATGTASTTGNDADQPSMSGAGGEFMRDLVAAMRRVADEARQNGVSELRARADEHVRKLEEDAERRREELRTRAEADIAGVGEWAKAEAERIKAEAEQRVVARRAQLEQQLAGDQTRTEAETRALRERVSEYERELEAYHAQLTEINDPAAFAAAAKRMPPPPGLGGDAGAATEAAAPTAATPPAPDAPVEPAAGGSNGVEAEAAAAVHPAEEEVLATRLAELDAALPEKEAAAVETGEPVTTEIVVKGLGSFGAITGFRQSLAGVEGVDGVALSLGQTGEFVFRATHGAGFDMRGAITGLEGDNARIEERPEGGIKVTLERAR